ncbi:calcium-binding protein [Streptomyces sp. NPDC086554]|uniref:calcium-binding protein n=1 Tax=Streptomyces sp. NPDC086554 TaxID=3154864 RepID=UPI003416BB86
MTLALGTGLAAPLFLAGTAGADTPSATAAFSASDHAILYTAASGQTNKVTVTASKSGGSEEITYVIDDDVPVSAGDGCSHPDGADDTKVSCTVATLESQDPYATLKLALRDGDDTVAYDNTTDQTYYFASADLGDGKDTATHTGGVDGNSVRGGAGDDNLSVGVAGVVGGGDGDDTLHATDGSIAQGGSDDELYGGPGRDTLSGGPGRNIVHQD